MARIPLFPLPMVLFPGTVALLHIFEPRYRQLLVDCLAGDRRFGLLCCPTGTPETAIPPGTVGTVAFIETAHRLGDGRSNIAVRGVERFRFLGYTTATTPYLMGESESFGERPVAASPETMHQLGLLFDRVVVASRIMVDDSSLAPELPEPHELRTFAMAQFMDLPLATRQGLLEVPDAGARAERLIALIDASLPALEDRATRHRAARANGHGQL